MTSRGNIPCSQTPDPRMTRSSCFLHSIMDFPLDFSIGPTIPLIALFFACNSNFDKDGVVFQSYEFSRKIFNEERDDILAFPHITLLYPNLTDVRYKNQNGLFVLYPEPWKENFERISTKYIIPAGCKKNILNQLKKIGITRAFIMPSLDSLCKDIVEIHSIRYPYAMKG